MDDVTIRPRLLGLAGSLRRESYSLAVLRGLQAQLGAKAELRLGDLRLPLYNEDEDGKAAPTSVREFRRELNESDAVVIATPEYNHGMSGVLKNALDWASRPFGKSVLIGKPVLVISVSPAFTGGARAQAQVNETLLATEARIVPGPQVVIGNVAEKIRDGRLVHESSLQFALNAMDRLITTRPAILHAAPL
jgi:chromate reductase, NAD(P)H dehydrogenase (quinone)